MSLIGGVCFIVMDLVAGAAWTALAVGADTLSDDAMLTLMYLDVGAYQVPGFGFGVFVAAASLVIATTGALRRWLGYVGLPLGVALLLSPLNIVEDSARGGPLDLMTFFAFLLAQRVDPRHRDHDGETKVRRASATSSSTSSRCS